MYFVVGIVVSFIVLLTSIRDNKRAYREFIAESAPDEKQKEIGFFHSRYKAAKTKSQKQEIRESQAEYWHYYAKAMRLGRIAVYILILGIFAEILF